ncbi:MAG: tetratricopeptide repeat protein, partial [Luteimonas sp.]
QDLRAVVAGQPISLRSDRAYRTGLFLRRHKLSVAAATLAALGLIATTGWALWQTRQARQEAMASENVSELLISAFDAANPATRQADHEPTAVDVLDASAASVSETLAETPALRARMQLLLGRAYSGIGYREKSAQLLNTSIQAFLTPEVNDPHQAAEALSALASVEYDLEHRDRGASLARRAYEMRKRYGASPKEMMQSSELLAAMLMGASDFDQAERLMISNKALITDVYGDPSLELAGALTDLGVLGNLSGQVRKGESQLRASLSMKKALKANTAAVLASSSNLAISLRRLGRFREAEALHLENMKLTRAAYPVNSTYMANQLDRLGSIYRDKGDLVRAQRAYERAIASANASQSTDRAFAALLMTYLAEVQDGRGDIEEAARNYRTAAEILNSAPDVGERMKLRAATVYDAFLARRGRGGLKRERLDSLLRDWLAFYKPEARRHSPPELAEAQFLDAEYRIATGRLDSVEASLPKFDPDPDQPLQQARRHYLLAKMHMARRDGKSAMREFDDALRIADAVAGRQAVFGAGWRLDYAELLADNQMSEDARSQIALAGPVLRQQMVPASPSLVRLQNLETRLGTPH